MAVMQVMMSKLELTVNETKARLCRLPEESFDFLGYTIGRCYSPRTGEAYEAYMGHAGRGSRSPGSADRSTS